MPRDNVAKIILMTSLTTIPAMALGHGLMVDPPARNAHCGLNEKADQAVSPACIAAAEADANGLYQFMSVLTHDIGRTGGQSDNVCGFDSETWQGGITPWDLPLDWPTTPIVDGPLTITWDISWGPHFDDTEEFRYWITKPGFQYQVGTPLSWSDFEAEPFCVLNYDDNNPNADLRVVADKAASQFKTTCDVPERSGRHVIYGEWGRNQYTYERFHGCVDVMINDSAPPISSSSSSIGSQASSSSTSSSSSNSSSSSIVSSDSTPANSSSSSSSGTANVSCDYVVSNEWNSGFVADIRLTNNSANIVDGWTVSWDYADGSTIEQAWNAEISGTGPYSASGVGWNQSILPGQTVTFGVKGAKGGAEAPMVELMGDICR